MEGAAPWPTATGTKYPPFGAEIMLLLFCDCDWFIKRAEFKFEEEVAAEEDFATLTGSGAELSRSELILAMVPIALALLLAPVPVLVPSAGLGLKEETYVAAAVLVAFEAADVSGIKTLAFEDDGRVDNNNDDGARLWSSLLSGD